MKKIFLLVTLLVFSLLFLFIGCAPTIGGNSGNGGNTGGEKDDLTAVSSLFEVKYSKIHITVTTEADKVSLKNEFDLSFDDTGAVTVSYVVNTVNEITIDGEGNLIIPSSQYEVKTGSVEISKDGTVSLISGDEVDLDFSNISEFTLNLTKDNLTDLTLTDVKLTANVNSPATLLNDSDLDAKNCTLSIYFYPEEAIKNVKINYETKNGEAVKIVYNFTK